MKTLDSYRDVVDELHAQLRGQPLSDWVRDMRDPDREGGRVPWRAIRDELRDETGITVSDMALLRWFPDPDPEDDDPGEAA